MKANAPEKIHIQPNAHDRWFEGNIPNGLPNRIFVEYTRTDAFIEMAQLFLIDKLKEIPMGNGKTKIKADCSLEEFVDEFQKYMKGEKV